MLSILIPTYNCPCLDLVKSLQGQCASVRSLEWEIIVADDGSTDAASVAANEAINTLPCCRYIIREENVGRAAIRNFLASEAKYEWLLFLDSDVEIRRHDFISQYLNACADYDLVCGRYDLPVPSESLLRNLRYRYERSYISRHSASVRNLHPFQSLSTANFLIRRSIMLAHPFNEVIRRYGYEDVLLGKSLALSHARVLHIDNPVTLRSFDTNADYLSKVEASLITLRDIHDDIHGYSLLLHYADLPFVSSIMKCFYRIFKPLLHKNLCGNSPSLLLFRFYKIGYYLSLK